MFPIYFNIILALVSASLFTYKLLSDFSYLINRNHVFISGYKSFAFALLTEKKNIEVLAVLKSCDAAKRMSTDEQCKKKSS